MPSSKSQLASPVATQERLHNVDTLRGVALLGILIVNLFAFSAPYYLSGVWQLSVWQGWWNKALELAVWVLAEGAFYSIFSMLFGLGFAIQLQRAQARGNPFSLRFSRRLLVLLVIGLVHLFGIWFGDILTVYAVTGFVLLAFVGRNSRTILLWIIALALFSVWLLSAAPHQNVTLAASQANVQHYLELYQSNWTTIQALRIKQGWQGLFGIFFLLPTILWLFLLGMLAQQQGLLRNPRPLLLKRILIFTLPIALLCKGLYGYLLLSQPAQPWRLLLSTAVGGPLLGISYAIMLILWLQNAQWQQRLSPIAKVGRMALSNYLAQSILCTLIFYGYGLGFYGTMPPSISLPLMLAIYAMQVGVSGWWLERFPYGPMEWLWRRLTYGRLS